MKKGEIMFEAAKRTPITFTEVTLRDGEQQKIKEVTIEDRIAVFDSLVETGIQVFEIGHLGNKGRDERFAGDQAFASALIKHIQEREEVDSKYNQVKLQVLFGSQKGIMEGALESLEGFDKDRVIIHVYDRLHEPLRDLASTPYTAHESAQRVCEAADIAIGHGYKNFSISGEGATGSSLDEAFDFYSSVAEHLSKQEVDSINVNLANTYGLPPEGDWGAEGLRLFNDAIKEKVPGATTSVHAHNDDRSSIEFSIAAVKAGFDTIEGTLFGMGERSGNTALCDAMIRLLEIARAEVAGSKRSKGILRLGSVSARQAVFEERFVPEPIIENLTHWYNSSSEIASIYGTEERLEATSLGDPNAYKAGSGPHDHASAKALEDPARHPLWRSYLSIAVVHAALGRPEAEGILQADPETIRSITIDGSAGGGATTRIVNGEIQGIDSREKAIADAQLAISEALGRAA